MATHWGWLFALSHRLPSADLRKSELCVGSGEGCDLVVHWAERRHFKISLVDSRPHITAYGDTDLEGVPLRKGRRTPLNHNAAISIFNTEAFVFLSRSVCSTSNYPEEISGRYAVSLSIGEGAFGDVYLVFDKRTHSKYAMKIVPMGKDEEGEKCALAEICNLSKLKHPCIIRIAEAVVLPRTAYLLLEHLEGGDLQQLLRTQRLSESQAQILFFQLCHALRYIHSLGIVHRDVKPENVLLTSRCPECRVKLADFGHSKDERQAGGGGTSLVGTPCYVAPEILRPPLHPVAPNKADVWSLGVLLFHCLSGKPPFDGEEVLAGRLVLRFSPQRWSSVSRDATDAVAAMLTVSPSQRPDASHMLRCRWLQDGVVRRRAQTLMGLRKPSTKRRAPLPPPTTNGLQHPPAAWTQPPPPRKSTFWHFKCTLI